MANDRTLFVTLSFYINQVVLVDKGFHGLDWSEQGRRKLKGVINESSDPKADCNASNVLRDAIEPFLNDVAIRDKNSTLSEFFVATTVGSSGETIGLRLPRTIGWQTEGETFTADLGHEIERDMQIRTFWYVHGSGALSYHVSLEVPYGDSYDESKIEAFYVLSALQKLAFPKELARTGHSREQSGIALLDNDAKIRSENGKRSEAFWVFLQRRFNREFETFKSIVRHSQRSQREGGQTSSNREDYWDTLLPRSDFIEVPGLQLPQTRALFLFRDANFFDLLKSMPGTVTLDGYKPIEFDNPDGTGAYLITKELVQCALSDPKRINIDYYFLSGFFQNIIDFLRQDASEINDGAALIYPDSEEAQEKEEYFFRAANSRAIYQVVKNSRSLEAGLPYIGTCPYVFLVHLTAVHNEILIRNYEVKVNKNLDELEHAGGEKTRRRPLSKILKDLETRRLHPSDAEVGGKTRRLIAELQECTTLFYSFRHTAFSDYTRHLYPNYFRYETESAVFEKVSKIRGTQTRLDYCNDMMNGVNRTIKDLEEEVRNEEQRIQHKSDSTLNRLLFLLGLLAGLQIFFTIKDSVFGLVGGENAKCDFVHPPILFECVDTTSSISAAITILLIVISALIALRLFRIWVKLKRESREDPESEL